MNRRTLFILLVMFVGLAIITVFQGHDSTPLKTNPTVQATFQRVYPNLAVLDIQAIRLEQPSSGNTFTIGRSTDGRWIVPDGEGTLDTDEAIKIARTVVLLPYERIVEATDNTDLEAFGFHPNGTLLVSILLTDGERLAVAVGGLTPTRDDYYAIIEGRKDIHLIKRSAIDFLIVNLVTPPVT